MFENLPEECENLIFKFHNQNIRKKLKEKHNKNFSVVMDELMLSCDGSIMFFGLQDKQLEEPYEDICFTSYLIAFIACMNEGGNPHHYQNVESNILYME